MVGWSSCRRWTSSDMAAAVPKKRKKIDKVFKGKDGRIKGHNLVVKEVEEDVSVRRSHATVFQGTYEKIVQIFFTKHDSKLKGRGRGVLTNFETSYQYDPL